MTIILGIKLSTRIDKALEVQRIISNFGCAIKTRLGMHNTDGRNCSADGIILLEIIDTKSATNIANELIKIDGIEIQQMIF